MKKIFYGKNIYNNNEIKAVVSQLRKSTQMGRNVAEFEEKISKMFGKKYSLMVNSGSSALMLAFKVFNFKPNDEIITPCLNFGTAVSSLLHFNLKPIFVDIDIDTLQINTDLIKKKITKKTKALLIPNLIGNLPDWIKIKKLAKKYNLKIIEDSADTIGHTINNKNTSSISDIAITSFYGSHIISCAGNGGIFLTNNKKQYERAKILRSWGRMSTLIKDSENINHRLKIKLDGVNYDKKFVFSELGYNFEPSEIGAAFGLEQIKKFNMFQKKRNENFYAHLKFFSKYKKIFVTPRIVKGVKTNFLAYPIIIKKNKYFSRKKFQIFLENNKIQTRPIFSGNILRHPAFEFLKSNVNKVSSFQNADYIMKQGILIGCHQGINKLDLKRMHSLIEKFILKYF